MITTAFSGLTICKQNKTYYCFSYQQGMEVWKHFITPTQFLNSKNMI